MQYFVQSGRYTGPIFVVSFRNGQRGGERMSSEWSLFSIHQEEKGNNKVLKGAVSRKCRQEKPKGHCSDGKTFYCNFFVTTVGKLLGTD